MMCRQYPLALEYILFFPWRQDFIADIRPPISFWISIFWINTGYQFSQRIFFGYRLDFYFYLAAIAHTQFVYPGFGNAYSVTIAPFADFSCHMHKYIQRIYIAQLTNSTRS